MEDLTVEASIYLLATRELETEQRRYLRVLHCVLDRSRPETSDLASAVWLCNAIEIAGERAAGRCLVRLVILWRTLLPIALADYYSLEAAA